MHRVRQLLGRDGYKPQAQRCACSSEVLATGSQHNCDRGGHGGRALCIVDAEHGVCQVLHVHRSFSACQRCLQGSFGRWCARLIHNVATTKAWVQA